ncbi:holin [Bacillus subtilis]|uniref:Holin n=2 Tax=Bacillus subtilis TaxID=1423 RepID=A0AAP1H7A6_BACIU|nr:MULTISPECIES: holin [Bacillus]URO01720.1 holin [Bacillus phage 268TH007]URO01822.1 holin [Bacillus phage 268TH002]WJD91257.1 holin [Bacillus spizizenii]WNA14194.1 holin [Bacillus phage phi18-2]KAF1340208.1 Holin [Bacillus subtilis]
MQDVLIFATVLAPILTALVQLVKKTVKLPTNVIPALSFVIGIGLGAVAYPFTDLDLVLRLWAGGFAGLAATGLFELGAKREGTTK